MRRGWKIAIGVAAVLVALLILNTIAVDHETKGAEVTVPGGRILDLPGGDVQVLDVGPRAASPIVLIHCYTCAIDWWNGMIPLLRRDHRVIAIDLLGHGGSEKPGSGYEIDNQASLVAQALNRLGVRRATVVGHSLGGTVATALTEKSPDLVRGLVIVDQAPDSSYGGLNLLAKITYVPVVGEALWRTTPDFLIKDGLGQAFAPGFDVPDEFVDDFRRMTFTSYDDAASSEEDFTDEKPLDQRLEPTGVPLLVIFGSEDQIYDEDQALSAYGKIPGAETKMVEGAGHSPNVEKPEQTAALVLAFESKLGPRRLPSGDTATATGTGSPSQVVARCGDAIIGPGDPQWRRRSTVAGDFGLFGGGRDFQNANRVGEVFEAKIPAVLESRQRAVLAVPGSERGRVGLLYGAAKQAATVDQAPIRIVFRPCTDQPRTVWPGGLVLASRKQVTLQVVQGGKTESLRVG